MKEIQKPITGEIKAEDLVSCEVCGWFDERECFACKGEEFWARAVSDDANRA